MNRHVDKVLLIRSNSDSIYLPDSTHTTNHFTDQKYYKFVFEKVPRKLGIHVCFLYKKHAYRKHEAEM